MKRTIAIATLLALATSAAACGEAGTGDTTAGTAVVTNDLAETEYKPNIEAKDYGGADFTILTRKTDTYTRQLDDISAAEENGTPLNDEIFKRNSRVMNKYNLVFNIVSDSNVTTMLRNSIAADDDEFQIVFNGISDSVALSAEGFLYDLSTFPYLDITQSYWSNAIMDDISIYNKNYIGISDLTIQAYFASGIIYFNKQLAEDYKIDDPYQLVRDGDWTFDKMIELCRNVSADVNGNNEYDEKDQYGLTFNNFAWQILYYGGGETFVKKDAEGSLYLDSKNERIINICTETDAGFTG